jgi:predicted DNA-binding protein
MKRININLDDKTFEVLENLAKRKGKTMSETLRDGLDLENWFQEVKEDGDKIIVENSSTGKTQQIIRR